MKDGLGSYGGTSPARGKKKSVLDNCVAVGIDAYLASLRLGQPWLPISA